MINKLYNNIIILGELQEHTDIKSNDIVAGGQLHMTIWHTWVKLINAVVTNNISEVSLYYFQQLYSYLYIHVRYTTKPRLLIVISYFRLKSLIIYLLWFVNHSFYI